MSPKTRDKVLKFCELLGFHPDALAQGLAKKRTRLITAIVPVLSNHFFMEVLAGMQGKLQAYDYDLNIYNVKVGDSLEEQVEYMMLCAAFCGVFFFSRVLKFSIILTHALGRSRQHCS